MRDQIVRGTSPQPFAHGARLVAFAIAVVLALSGCLFEGAPRPPTPTPVPPTPTPLPTPTAQARVVLPTAAPTGTPGPTPTVTPTPIRELGGAGGLLYQGSLNGRQGLILVDADGGERRLIAEGYYLFGAWSPDGQRIAAAGNDDVQSSAHQVDLLAADGRRLRRFAFEGVVTNLSWAPDGGRVAVGVAQPRRLAGGERAAEAVTWLLDEGGATEVVLGQAAHPLQWSPGGRLLLEVAEDGDGDSRDTDADRHGLWTVDPSGHDPRKLLGGGHNFVGWSPDGATLYALDFSRVANRPDAAPDVWETALLALDVGTGERRTLVTVGALAARLGGAGDPAVAYSFGGVAIAPRGDRIAVWLNAFRQSAHPTESLTSVLFILDDAGRVAWQEEGMADRRLDSRDEVSWSPDGARLAYIHYRGGVRGLRVVSFDAGGALRDQFVVEGAPVGARWSPDGRWLAFTQAGWLRVAPAEPPARSWSVRGADPGNQVLLGWRPAGRR